MSTTRISRRIEWDMGHRIPDHESLCKSPHGHRYAAEVVIEGPVVDKQGSPSHGMVADFGELKVILQFIPNRMDHAFMVYKDDPLAAYLAQFEKHLYSPNPVGDGIRIMEVDFVPTAENIAGYIFKKVAANSRLRVVEVTVWETPSCKAVYRP